MTLFWTYPFFLKSKYWCPKGDGYGQDIPCPHGEPAETYA